MKFTISDKTLRRVLVGVAVVTILLLIFFRVRSKYQYPNSAAAAKGEATVSGATAASGVVTITTNPAHGYAAGDVVLYGSPTATSYIIQTVPLTTTFTILSTAAATTFTVGSKFKPAYKTLTDALEQCNVDNLNNPNDATFTTCITNKTADYVASMCPWITNTPTSATASSAVVSAKTTFDNDIAIIKTAYTALQNGASADLTPIVNAARRADITGATRKYLTAVCPSYYVPAAGGSAPAEYATWQGFAATSSGGVGTVPSPAPKVYFDASKVGFKDNTQKTAALNRITEWAKYASSDTGTTPLISGCTLHTGGTAPNLNWKLAQQYGPGTVVDASVATLPWNTAVATCPKPGTWTIA